MTLQIDSLLKNRYRIQRVIARGGMGAIYAAYDESLSVAVAVKENLTTLDEATRQFRREASILASLRHPNLPRVTDHFVIPEQGQYLVMDFIEGEDLKDRITRMGSLSEQETALIGIAISDALFYMHTRKPAIVHRDIKPGNIKISPSGEVYLVDFGIAKISQADHGTTIGAQSLTPGFAPPEQYGQGTDPRSDIYALGATLYMAATGFVPVQGISRLMNQQQLTPMRDLKPEISPAFAGIIETALAVKREDRFQSADEMNRQLKALYPDVSAQKPAASTITVDPAPTVTRPRPVSPVEPQPVGVQTPQIGKKSGKKIPVWVWITGLAALLLIAVMGVLIIPRLFPEPAMSQNTLITQTLPAVVVTETKTVEIPSATVEPITQPPDTLTPEVQLAAAEATATQEPSPELSPTADATALGGGPGQILFVSDRTGKPQLFLMNEDGTDIRQITEEKDGACQPDWSPDASRIVFVSPCKAQTVINPQEEVYRGATLFLINADGTDRKPVASFPGGDFDPAWSPDGTQILFASYRDNLTSTDLNLYRYNLTDNSTTVITKDLNSDRHPAWSPDGQNIVFQRQPQGGSAQIDIMAADGSGIYIFTNQQQNHSFMPCWGPDDTILFSRGNPFSVPYVRPLSPRNAQEIQLSSDSAWDMDFSADGYWIVFERVVFAADGSRNYDIYVMASTSGSAERLTDDPARDYQPVWMP